MLVLNGCSLANEPPEPQVVFKQVPVLIAIPQQYLKDCDPDYILTGDPTDIQISDIFHQSIIRSDRLKKCRRLHSDLVSFYLEAKKQMEQRIHPQLQYGKSKNDDEDNIGIILSNIN